MRSPLSVLQSMSLSQYDSSDTSEVFKDTQENLDADEVIERRSKYVLLPSCRPSPQSPREINDIIQDNLYEKGERCL